MAANPQEQYQQHPPAPQPAPAPAAAPAPAPESDMSKDVNHWVDRANQTIKDPSGITAPEGSSAWHTGFFECFDPIDTCFLTCCCPCITFGKTHHRLHKGSIDTWSPINGSCLLWYGTSCFGCQCIPTLMQRAEIRERASPKLSGNPVKDFLKAWCCTCCDLIQQEKEAEWLLKNQASMAQQPTQQAEMTYPPPKE